MYMQVPFKYLQGDNYGNVLGVKTPQKFRTTVVYNFNFQTLFKGNSTTLQPSNNGFCVGGRYNCDPIATHGPYLRAIEIKGL